MIGLVDGFEWDDGNRDKCQKHGVSLAEIEALFEGELRVFPDTAHSHLEARYLGIGQTPGKRYVFLAFTIRAYQTKKLIRPISARYMHAKEVQHYEAQIAKS